MCERCWSSSLSWLACLLLISTTADAFAATTTDNSAAILRSKYASLEERLRVNQFKQPLALDSAETRNRLQGDVYAVVDHSFGAVGANLSRADHWCDVMLLHINVKYCRSAVGTSGILLSVRLGRKISEDIADAALVEFHFDVAASTPDYLEVVLNAKDGPLGTSDYHIVLEAVALPSARTFIHLTYSYAMNASGWLAMETYLATIGRNKVGFTATGMDADGTISYIGGVRGVVERNTMRYYLAIVSYLGAVGVAPADQPEQRFQGWFSAVEQFPQQLHEMDRREYLDMKRAEYLRQQTVR